MKTTTPSNKQAPVLLTTSVGSMPKPDYLMTARREARQGNRLLETVAAR